MLPAYLPTYTVYIYQTYWLYSLFCIFLRHITYLLYPNKYPYYELGQNVDHNLVTRDSSYLARYLTKSAVRARFVPKTTY